MLNIIVKTVVIYIIIVISMRLMGKKQSAELQPYELVITLMIAEVASTPMNSPGTPMIYGLAPALTRLLVYDLFSLLSLKSKRLRLLLCGKPSILIQNGVLDIREISKINYNLNDLMEQLRISGYTNIPDIHYAILETNGQLSVLPYANYAPITPSCVDLEVEEEDLSTALILDGVYHQDSMRRFGLDKSAVDKLLHTLGFNKSKQVFIFTVSDKGSVFVQDRQGNTKNTRIPALKLV